MSIKKKKGVIDKKVSGVNELKDVSDIIANKKSQKKINVGEDDEYVYDEKTKNIKKNKENNVSDINELEDFSKPKRGRPKKGNKSSKKDNIESVRNKTDKKNIDFDEKKIDITYGSDTIPEKTKLRCWKCTFEFDNKPWGLPAKYCKGVYMTIGNFCSPNCALGYNLDLKDSRVIERNSLFKDYYRKKMGCNDKECDELIPAPSKEILDVYGGPYTIEQYRKNFNKKKISIIEPPMKPLKQFIEEN